MKTDPKFEDLAALWAKGVRHPVYLFAGPDTVRKEEALALFRARFFSQPDADFNIDKFDGDTASGADILNALQTLAFLGPGRLVLVRRADQLSAADAGRLADGLGGVPKGNTLILFWEDRLDNRSVLTQAVRSAEGIALTFWAPFEEQLPRWVQDRVRSLGKTMGVAAAEALIESVGSGLGDLAQEIEKLALYVGDRKDISAEDVASFRPDTRPLESTELDRALWRRDTPEALRLLGLLQAQGDPPELLIAHMARVYRKLLLGKTLLGEKKVSPPELWNHVWIRKRAEQEEYTAALARYSWRDLLDALGTLVQAEWELKTGQLDPETGLTLVVRNLTGKAAALGAGRGEAVHRAREPRHFA
jgi:DNA polymerase III subunit delta